MSHWLIVGASRGIGLEAARQLSARGERVTASVRDAAGSRRAQRGRAAGDAPAI